MRHFIVSFALLLFSIEGFCLDKLSENYLVRFGDPEAKVQIVQYFSFQCAHCLGLFRKDFQQIKNDYLDTGKASWVFHPGYQWIC